jgi:CheY-like chemotaxis protein
VTDDPAALQRLGESLERAAWIQVRLIDDLLDVSRLVAGKLALELRALDLGGVVRAALDNVIALAEAKSLVLSLVLEPAPDAIWGDHRRVQQVVTNLLTNAIKFTPSGGRVTVTIDTVAGAARLRVMDTGIGIAAGFLPQVFAHFSQRDTSITREYGGLGLGLALVRHLVELHHGTVLAESAGEGHGATFSVTFPLADAQSEHDADRPSAIRESQALDRPGWRKSYDALVGLRVLFVDDDLRTREAVQEVLRLAGALVELAASAHEGVAAVDVFKPQVILCDIAMPGEDGYAFIRKLRAREAAGARPIPALAFTALTAEDDRRRALAAGFALHLTKPIDIDRLRDAVLELALLAASPAGHAA